jgi:hypothetical protein
MSTMRASSSSSPKSWTVTLCVPRTETLSRVVNGCSGAKGKLAVSSERRWKRKPFKRYIFMVELHGQEELSI